MWTFILGSIVFVIFFAGLSVRLLLGKKDGFRGTCASQNAVLLSKGADGICGACGKPLIEAGNCDRTKLEKS